MTREKKQTEERVQHDIFDLSLHSAVMYFLEDRMRGVNQGGNRTPSEKKLFPYGDIPEHLGQTGQQDVRGGRVLLKGAQIVRTGQTGCT